MADSQPVRRDPVSGLEVIYAAGRRNRPRQFSRSGNSDATAPCPFCPGNESMLPSILWQDNEGDGWLTRAVPNLYPIVTPPVGCHEVIVETRRHAWSSGGMTLDVWSNILGAYAIRYGELTRNWRHVSLFRNVGARAGGSLEHPHSQLIALAHMPAELVSRRRRLRHAYGKTGHCALCTMIDGMRNDRDGALLVTRTASFAAIVPVTAEVPCEVWIVPTVHESMFDLSRADEKEALAGILLDVLGRLDGVLGDFDHNMVLMDSDSDAQPWLHWYLRIRPVQGPGGGFELATGISVNPSRPASDAASLRGAAAKLPGA